MFNKKEMKKEITKICTCGVPLYLHATCCGWLNANYCIAPKNDEEREYKRLWEEAHPNTGFAGVQKEQEKDKPKLTEKVDYAKDVQSSMSDEEIRIVNMLADQEPSCYADIAAIMIEYTAIKSIRISELEARVRELEGVLDKAGDRISDYLDGYSTLEEKAFQSGIACALKEIQLATNALKVNNQP